MSLCISLSIKSVSTKPSLIHVCKIGHKTLPNQKEQFMQIEKHPDQVVFTPRKKHIKNNNHMIILKHVKVLIKIKYLSFIFNVAFDKF